jgi:phosphoglycerol transferase MdoB-like AlkP superfamily enzyme
MFLLWAFLCWLLIFLAQRRPFFNKLIYHGQWSFFVFNFPMFALWIGLVILGIRGGIQLKPLSPVMASSITSPERLPIVLNTPFSIIKTIKNQPLVVPTYLSDEKANKLFNPDQKVPNDSINGTLKGYNVVILILESFSYEHTTLQGNKKGFTPFIDSLAQVGIFTKGIANGKRSIEAIPAILSSLPTWMNYDFITSPYSGNKINSLPSLLKPLGYRSIFLHGGNNGTMSFDAYSAMAGFDEYIGRKEYNNDHDFDGTWGIWDEPFLLYTNKKLSQTKQPFLAALFTLSSHHPYKVPVEYMYKLPKGSLPIQQSIAYADLSLRKFFKAASKEPWFTNTLFVLVADHTSEGATPVGRTKAGQYTIPIIFYTPSHQLTPFVKSAVQQTDIMPGVLHLLGYSNPFTAFGESPFTKGSNVPAISYTSGTWNLFRNDTLLEFNGKNVSALFNLTKDPLQSKNLSKQSSLDLNITDKGKAIIQLYYERMKNNQLTPQ